MAHFAELDKNNIVLRVCVIDDAHEADGENWCANFSGGTWKQTSYNNTIRKRYAGVGMFYDSTKNKFISPQPYASWSLNSNDDWKAPTALPEDGAWDWDESTLSWVELELPEIP
jgi:hypothetical protein|tara:strand:- start:7159 stop:7500 length:342 start_codon:yes stop_codon:yes gene_type:complete